MGLPSPLFIVGSTTMVDADALLWPYGTARFRRDVWLQRPVFLPEQDKRFPDPLSAFANADIRSLVGLTTRTVQAWMKQEDGRVRSASLHAKEAVECYQRGATLCITADRAPFLVALKDTLGTSLGLPPGYGFANLIAVRSPFLTPCHFDPNENFTLQLRGTKRWLVHENLVVPNPLHNCIMNGDVHEELRLYAGDPTKEQLNDAVLDVQLEPGSVLYVPRGYWHRVESSGPSLQLNLAFPAFPWVDAALPLIRRLLLREPAWRASAYEMMSIGSVPRDALVKMEEMLNRLPANLLGLSRLRLTPQYLSDVTSVKLWHNQICSYCVRKDSGHGALVAVTFIVPMLVSQECIVAATMLPILEWMAHIGRAFCVTELQSTFPTASEEEVLGVTRAAIEGCFLTFEECASGNSHPSPQ